MGEKWLTCEVLKGMFSDEVAVRFLDHRRKEVSFFVPRDKVRMREQGRGEVVVRIIERDDAHYAVLPTAEQSLVPVREEDLVAP